MTRSCYRCGVHSTPGERGDHTLTGIVLSLLFLWVVVSISGCLNGRQPHYQDPKMEPPHYGSDPVKRMVYCRNHHGGAHLPETQDECERWQ